jgi:pimeloyl-ACP methyl ester carboxylesterase
MKRLFKSFLIGLSLLFAGNYVYLYNAQDSLIFHYKTLPRSYNFQMSQKFEERTYSVDRGVQLNALYFSQITEEETKGVVICFHGRGTNLSRDWGKLAALYIHRGYDFIVYDYRGFGKSDGHIDPQNIYNDPIKMYEIITSEYKGKKTIVLGRSMGTNFATYVASIKKPDALILDAPFYSMLDMACLTKPYIPRILLEKILKYPMFTNQYIKKVDCPILIFHGTEDNTVPYCESVRLFDIIKHKQKNHFVKLEGADHFSLAQHPEYEPSIDAFLKDL